MKDDDTRMLRGLIEQILIDLKKKRESMKSYCTQNDGNCWTCSLVSYGKDCQNNPVPRFPIATYRVYESDLTGWTVETLATALEEPMAAIGVQVEAHPRESGPTSLLITEDIPLQYADYLEGLVSQIVEMVTTGGQ